MGVLSFLLVLTVMFATIIGREAQSKSLLISCGTNASVDVGSRRWIGDSAPGNNVTLSSLGIEASTAMYNGNPIYEPLYRTARIFTESLNYTLHAEQGKYFLRLHFYPFAFGNYDFNSSYFGVIANGLTLVSEFNVPGELLRKNSFLQSSGGNITFSALVKEYYFTIDAYALVLEFIPKKGSFGFVTAVEIIPVGGELFVDSVSRVGGGARSSFDLNRRGIETMYRLNVGGSKITTEEDSDFWREWELDSSYMINAAAGSEISNRSDITYASQNDSSMAPLLVYETARMMSNNTQVMERRFNMSWKLEVDPDFDYLVRLHFCELQFERPNQRIFRIYINNKTTEDNFDIFLRAGGMNKAYHEDYIDAMPSRNNALWVQLGPDITTVTPETDALLNGLEIFKLSRNDNLAYVQQNTDVKGKESSKRLFLWVGIGAGIASIAILASVITLVIWFCRRRRSEEINTKKSSPGWRPLFLHAAANSMTHVKESTGSQNPIGSSASVRSGRRFTLAEIKAATNNFDETLVIGVGGFGKVFKGQIEDGTLAAIKRANPGSQQGLTEFETEIEMLSKLRHRHLVSMIGFCDEQNEMILVYEYMANGTLRSHLFGSNLPALSWKQRIEVCIGAARGLHYLHTGSERGIIHRDVKTTNILLDESFVAKVADFGLSKAGPALEHTHVSTAVKGSFGYLDPEYFRRQHLTEKSDVYSFGVVLFEVVCARPVINPSLPRDQINLAEWAMRWQRQRSLETIIDQRLRGKYSAESLIRFGEIAEKCLADEGKSRPTIGEVLWHLEYAFQLQEAWLRTNFEEYPSSGIGLLDIPSGGESKGLVDDELEEADNLKMETEEDGSPSKKASNSSDIAFEEVEFSQMINQQGR